LLLDIIEAHVIALLVGKCGSYKSFVALNWAMQIAMAGNSVVLLSAEGVGLGRRLQAWMKVHAPNGDIPEHALALERIVNLNDDTTLEQIASDLEDEEFGVPDLIVIDTYSKYAAGLKENDNTEVSQFLTRLSTRLKERYGCTILIVAHTGNDDDKQHRARGASALKANTDAEYIIQRFAGENGEPPYVTVSRDRFKDSGELPPLSYRMESVDLGREDKYGKRVTSLAPMLQDVPAQAGAAVRPELRGKAQRQLLAALRELAKQGKTIWTLPELREVGRGAGMVKSTARAAAEALATSPFLTPTVGGMRLSDDA
jgi:hypothetical protein